MDRSTPEEARTWNSYMPRRGNGGVPLGSDVEQFLEATRSKPALRLKILSELRERSHMSANMIFGFAATGFAALALFSSIFGGVDSTDILSTLRLYGVIALVMYLLPCGLAMYNDGRARHATSWLAAYLDGEAIQDRSVGLVPDAAPEASDLRIA